MKVCLNENWRLTKTFPRQLFSKQEILVTSGFKASPISHLFHTSSGRGVKQKHRNDRRTR